MSTLFPYTTLFRSGSAAGAAADAVARHARSERTARRGRDAARIDPGARHHAARHAGADGADAVGRPAAIADVAAAAADPAARVAERVAAAAVSAARRDAGGVPVAGRRGRVPAGRVDRRVRGP